MYICLNNVYNGQISIGSDHPFFGLGLFASEIRIRDVQTLVAQLFLILWLIKCTLLYIFYYVYFIKYTVKNRAKYNVATVYARPPHEVLFRGAKTLFGY